MKKILALLTSISLLTSSVSLVTSCAIGSASYEGLFEENENSDDNNNGKYIFPGPNQVKEQIEKAVSEPIVANIQIRQNDQEVTSRTNLEDNVIRNNLKKYLEEQIGLNEKDESGKTLIERGFAIEIIADNTFKVPQLNGISKDGITFESKVANVELGKGSIRLTYLGNIIENYNFEWNVPEYQIIESIINALQTHSFDDPTNNFVNNIDLELFMGFTLGSLSALIGLLGINSTVNNISMKQSRSGIGDILGMIRPLVEPIQNLVNLDVKQLAEANPDDADGKAIYENFDKSFRENFKKLFAALSNVLLTLGIKDEITIPGIGDQPITFKISEFLDINILKLLPEDLLNSLNMEQDFAGMGTMKLNVTIGKKNAAGEYEVTMMNVLANIAPNIVLLLSKFLDKKTYAKTDNLLFLIFKELFTDMDPRLKMINEKNNSDNTSASLAMTGIDSIMFNLLLDYNKNNRTDPNKINLDVRITLNLNVSLIGDKTPFNNSTLYEVLNYVIIKPGEIVLRIANNLFDLKGAKTIDLNTPFIGPNLNIDFSEYISMDVMRFIELLDLGALGPVLELIISFIKDSLQKTINDTLNSAINSALPEYSMQTVINMLPTSLISSLMPGGFDKTILDKATITIEKAEFVFQFKQYGNNEDWYSQTTSMVGNDFNIYDTMRLHVEKMQLRLVYETELNGKFEYLTKDNITFNLVFSATDAKENL